MFLELGNCKSKTQNWCRWTQLLWFLFYPCVLFLFIPGLSSSFVNHKCLKIRWCGILDIPRSIINCPLQPASNFSGARIYACLASQLHGESESFPLALQGCAEVRKQLDGDCGLFLQRTDLCSHQGQSAPAPEKQVYFRCHSYNLHPVFHCATYTWIFTHVPGCESWLLEGVFPAILEPVSFMVLCCHNTATKQAQKTFPATKLCGSGFLLYLSLNTWAWKTALFLVSTVFQNRGSAGPNSAHTKLN